MSVVDGYSGYNLVQACHAIAISNSAYYFGIEWGRECYWGSSTANLFSNGIQLKDSICNTFSNATTNAVVYGPNGGGSNYVASIYQVAVSFHRFNTDIYRLQRVKQVLRSNIKLH